MVKTSFSDANILNIFSGGSLLPGHTVQWVNLIDFRTLEGVAEDNQHGEHGHDYAAFQDCTTILYLGVSMSSSALIPRANHGIYIKWYFLNRCALKEQSLLLTCGF